MERFGVGEIVYFVRLTPTGFWPESALFIAGDVNGICLLRESAVGQVVSFHNPDDVFKTEAEALEHSRCKKI